MVGCETDWTPKECPPGCVYEAEYGGHTGCKYIFVESRSRGCEPGKECTCYRKAGERHRELRLPEPKAKPTPEEREAGPTKGRATWNVEAGRLMYEQGYNDREIAQELGVNVHQVRWQRSHNWGGCRGISARWSVGTGRKLWEQGLTDREIAEKVGTSTRNVSRVRKKHWECGK